MRIWTVTHGSASPRSSLNQQAQTVDTPPLPGAALPGNVVLPVRQPVSSTAPQLLRPPRTVCRKKPSTASALNHGFALLSSLPCWLSVQVAIASTVTRAVQLGHPGLPSPSPLPALLISPLLENSCLSLEPTVFKTHGSSKDIHKVLKFPVLYFPCTWTC